MEIGNVKRIVLSAELGFMGEGTNNQRTKRMAEIMLGVSMAGVIVEECNGVYKGTKEKSFMVIKNDYRPSLSFMKDLADNFQQESILVVNDNDESFLIYLNSDEIIKLDGVFKEVEDVKGLDAYTEMGGKFYAVC